MVPNEPAGLVINYLLKNDASGPVKVRVTDPYGAEVAAYDGSAKAGLQSVVWDFRRMGGTPAAGGAQPPGGQRGGGGRMVAPPGEYVVVLEAGGKKLTARATVRPAPERD